MARTPLFNRTQPGGVYMITDPGFTPGDTFFVHSGTGTDGAGYGRNPDAPVATIDYAIGLCTANKSDVIYVMPGHNEGLGNAQIAVDVAGISIVGLGRGDDRPRIDFDHANASIAVSVNGCTLKNLVLLPSVTDVLIGIDVNTLALGTQIEEIEVLPGEDGAGVDEFAVVVDVKVGCSRTVVSRLKVRQHASAAGVIAGVRLAGASDDVTVQDCDMVCKGAAVTAPITGVTTLSTNVRFLRNILVSDDEPGIDCVGIATSGVIAWNLVFSDLATIAAAIVATGSALWENEYIEVGPESGVIIGTASADD